MDDARTIESLAGALRLPVFRDYAKHALPGRPFDENLRELMSLELSRREDASYLRRVREAGFPCGKTLDSFKFPPSLPHLRQEQLLELAECRFIEDGVNVCSIGNSGTGKTHAMAAIGMEAVRRGYSVKFARVSDLVTMLDEAKSEKRLGSAMKTLLKYDLLECDELGYVHLPARKAQLLFDVVAKRCEAGGSIFITSNYAFSDWPQWLGDSVMTKAFVGKLTGSSVVLNMGGEDYRLYCKREMANRAP
jgi:DNA replication protein DnaC